MAAKGLNAVASVRRATHAHSKNRFCERNNNTVDGTVCGIYADRWMVGIESLGATFCGIRSYRWTVGVESWGRTKCRIGADRWTVSVESYTLNPGCVESVPTVGRYFFALSGLRNRFLSLDGECLVLCFEPTGVWNRCRPLDGGRNNDDR
jgi:hypothetical protein